MGKPFHLSEAQAEGVLGLTLRRLTGLEVGKLREEEAQLKATIAGLQASGRGGEGGMRGAGLLRGRACCAVVPGQRACACGGGPPRCLTPAPLPAPLQCKKKPRRDLVPLLPTQHPPPRPSRQRNTPHRPTAPLPCAGAQALLGDRAQVLAEVVREARELASKHGKPRATRLVVRAREGGSGWGACMRCLHARRASW
jgi:hypothetical protein